MKKLNELGRQAAKRLCAWFVHAAMDLLIELPTSR